MSKTLIFTATYNEAGNIAKFLDKFLSLDLNLDILIIDDNSPDETYKTIQKYSEIHPNIFLHLRKKKLGLDTAHKFAYNYAKKNNYTKLITLDADLSHDQNEIPKMINILDNHEFVIGSRYMKGGKCEMSIPRFLLSVIGNKIIKYLLKISSDEFTTSFRGFNIIKLNDFNLDMINSKGYSFFMETIFRIHQRKIYIKQIPIHFKNRSQGKSKIPKIEVIRTLKNLFFLYLNN